MIVYKIKNYSKKNYFIIYDIVLYTHHAVSDPPPPPARAIFY